MSHRFLHRRWAILLLLVAGSALIALGSLLPVLPGAALGGSSTKRIINNLLHVPAYAVLAILWSAVLSNKRALRERRAGVPQPPPAVSAGVAQPLQAGDAVPSKLRSGRSLRLRGAILPFIIATAYGVLMEVAQIFVPGRMGSVPDVLINAAGAAVGIAALRVGLAQASSAVSADVPQPLQAVVPPEPEPEWAD